MQSRHWLAALAAITCALPPAGQAQEAAAPAAAAVSSSAASSTGPDPVRGRRAFQRYCAVCHGAKGEGGLGPPLQGISARLTDEQIRHQILEPRNSMPRLSPAPVDAATLGDLLAYLGRLK